MVSCNVLESMISSIIPTSCEASDISNLVHQSVDCFILSGETSYGAYPVKSIETLEKICRETEYQDVEL